MYTPLLLSAGQQVIVTRDEVGLFPASSRTPKGRREVATLTAPPERYQPSMGRRARWLVRTDLGDMTVDGGQRLILA